MAVWAAFVFHELRRTGDLVLPVGRIDLGDRMAAARLWCSASLSAALLGARRSTCSCSGRCGRRRRWPGRGVGRRDDHHPGARGPAVRHRPPGGAGDAAERPVRGRAQLLAGPALARRARRRRSPSACGRTAGSPASGWRPARRRRASAAPCSWASRPDRLGRGHLGAGLGGRRRSWRCSSRRPSGSTPIAWTFFVVPALACALAGRLESVGIACAAGLALGSMQAEITFLSSRSVVAGLGDRRRGAVRAADRDRRRAVRARAPAADRGSLARRPAAAGAPSPSRGPRPSSLLVAGRRRRRGC